MSPPVICLIWPVGQVPSSISWVWPGGTDPAAGSIGEGRGVSARAPPVIEIRRHVESQGRIMSDPSDLLEYGAGLIVALALVLRPRKTRADQAGIVRRRRNGAPIMRAPPQPSPRPTAPATKPEAEAGSAGWKIS